MQFKDYYQILGINKNASAAEIRKAYRKLAAQYHPDRNPGNSASTEKFKEINEANEVLSDPEKRKKYDRFGQNWKHYQESTPPPQGDFNWSEAFGRQQTSDGQPFADFDLNDLFAKRDSDDFFEMLFGYPFGNAPRQRSTARKGRDINSETRISLEEAYHGTTKLFRLNNQTLKVAIHPGIKNGQVLRLSGKGAAGDLYITINVEADPRFKREGLDLYTEITVDLYTAILGGQMQVDTLKGKVLLTIPPGTDNGTTLRLNGMGMPEYGRQDRYGDLYVKVSLTIPRNLSAEEINLFKKLSALRNR
jgi:curved DNA-binding protein